jgi:hypothetical protein
VISVTRITLALRRQILQASGALGMTSLETEWSAPSIPHPSYGSVRRRAPTKYDSGIVFAPPPSRSRRHVQFSEPGVPEREMGMNEYGGMRELGDGQFDFQEPPFISTGEPHTRFSTESEITFRSPPPRPSPVAPPSVHFTNASPSLLDTKSDYHHP